MPTLCQLGANKLCAKLSVNFVIILCNICANVVVGVDAVVVVGVDAVVVVVLVVVVVFVVVEVVVVISAWD